MAARSSDVTVGIDIGTTSVKAVAVNGDGTVVARSRVRHPLLAGSAEELRHDPQRAWRRGPRRALKALGDLRPRALSVTGMVPSLAAIGRRGVPLSQGLLYGDGGGDAATFLRRLAAEHPDATGFWPAQTTALAALGGPPVVAATVSFVLGPLASGGRWDAGTLRAAGVDESRLPAIVPDRVPVAEVDGTLLDPGGIDVMCERIVSGATEPGDVLVLCGSTLVTLVRLPPGSEVPPAIQAFPDATGALTATTASNAGGLFLDWVDRVVAPARGEPAPHRVPVWSPYLRGERTPWEDPTRRAALVGLDIGHDAAALRRAAHEASAFVVRHHLDLLGAPAKRVVAVGGGTTSPGWMQALADVTGLPVDVQAVPDGAAMGAAFLARLSAGLESDLATAARWARVGRRVEPRPGWTGPVEERYRAFRRLADEVRAPLG